MTSSSVAAFQGLTLRYRLDLRQAGSDISGVGHKISENGAPLAPGAQTGIRVHGTIDGDRVILTFVEAGTRRPSAGKFVLFREGPDALRGRFSSDAARSTGTVEAKR